MIPHERSLVKKMEGKPFALLGIDFDATSKELKSAIDKEHITWRNWFDGSDGQIGKQWNVQVIPTFYILDAQGVIRYKGIHGDSGPEIDKAVTALLKEMGTEKRKPLPPRNERASTRQQPASVLAVARRLRLVPRCATVARRPSIDLANS